MVARDYPKTPTGWFIRILGWILLALTFRYIVVWEMNIGGSHPSETPGDRLVMEGEDAPISSRQIVDALVLETARSHPENLNNIIQNLDLESYLIEAMKDDPDCLDRVLGRALKLKRHDVPEDEKTGTSSRPTEE